MNLSGYSVLAMISAKRRLIVRQLRIIMKRFCLLTSGLAAALWLSARPAQAQILGDHYLAGTEGIQAGTLPGPGIYFDDINWFGDLDTHDSVFRTPISSYVNEPRLRWVTKLKLLDADYGVELMVPWGYQEDSVSPTSAPGTTIHSSQYELHDLEISPLLLGWHWQHFDLTAGYAFWVPTGDDSDMDPGNFLPPAQLHWWEHMLTLGGTWYPDAAHQWSLSDLNHYEINQSCDSSITIENGQLFTSEWGIGRMMGKYINLGIIGNCSVQTTETREYFPIVTYTTYAHVSVEVGPELKVNVPKYDFSVALRYLRELYGGPDYAESFDLNIVALTLSKRF